MRVGVFPFCLFRAAITSSLPHARGGVSGWMCGKVKIKSHATPADNHRDRHKRLFLMISLGDTRDYLP